MRNITKKFILTTAFITSVVSSALTVAQAHRMWMLPSAFTLSGTDQWVTVDGAVSNDLFFPNHVPLSLKSISVTAPDGTKEKVQNGSTGKFRTTFDVHLNKQGTYKIVEGGGTYFASWKEGGKTKRMRGNLEKILALKEAKKKDLSFHFAGRRVETFVTLGAPSDGSLKPTGTGLEMVPVTHPNDIFVGEEAKFKFIVNGKAAANLNIMIIKGHDRYRDQVNGKKIKTDANGIASFTLSTAGRYWLSTKSEPKETVLKGGQEMGQSMGYVATFEVLNN